MSTKKAAAFRDSPAFAPVQLADLPPHVGAVDWSLDAPLPASLPLIPLANLRESECRSESQSGCAASLVVCVRAPLCVCACVHAPALRAPLLSPTGVARLFLAHACSLLAVFSSLRCACR